jgi:DNA replication protein DnaC
LIEYYTRIPVRCRHGLGYVIPTKEQADCIFQTFSKRTEVTTTLFTTKLAPSDWGKISDPVTAAGTLDRLSLNGKSIPFEERSYRE